MWSDFMIDNCYVFGVCLLLMLQVDCSHYNHESQLHLDLFESYGREIRPAYEAGSPVLVQIYPTLVRVNGVHEDDGRLEATISLSMPATCNHLSSMLKTGYGSWVDGRLKWHSSDYGGITQTHVSLDKIWTPDISPSNGESASTKSTMAALSSSGTVAAVFLQTSRYHCDLDLRHFPHDTQSCDILLSSWIYSHSQLAIQFWSGPKYSSRVHLSDVMKTDSREWAVDENKVKASIFNVTHSCCPDDPFVQVKISIELVRQASLLSRVLVCQLAIFLLLLPLQFCLPATSNERALFGLFILVGDLLLLQSLLLCVPPLQSAIPIIGQLYIANSCLALIALVLSTLVTWVLRQQSTQRPLPQPLHQILLCLRPIFCYKEIPSGKLEYHNSLLKENMADDNITELDTFTEIHEQTDANGIKPLSEKITDTSVESYNATSTLVTSLRYTNRLLKDLNRVFQKKDCSQSVTGEWANLATMLDVLFFVAFVVAALVVIVLLLIL